MEVPEEIPIKGMELQHLLGLKDEAERYKLARHGHIKKIEGKRDQYDLLKSVTSYCEFMQSQIDSANSEENNAKSMKAKADALKASTAAENDHLDLLERREKVISRKYITSLWESHSENLNRIVDELFKGLDADLPDLDEVTRTSLLEKKAQLQTHIYSLNYDDGGTSKK